MRTVTAMSPQTGVRPPLTEPSVGWPKTSTSSQPLSLMTVTTPLSLPGKMSFVRSGCGMSQSDARSNEPVGPAGEAPTVTQPKWMTFSRTTDIVQVPSAELFASGEQSGFGEPLISSTGPRPAPAPPGPKTMSHGLTLWMTRLSYSTENSYAPRPSWTVSPFWSPVCTLDACSMTWRSPSFSPAHGPVTQRKRLAAGIELSQLFELPWHVFTTEPPSGVG